MDKVARHGDYSPRSFLCMELKRNGILINCHIDQERRWEAPNPKFCDSFAGGRSVDTYRALWQLHNELPTDEHQHAFIPSDKIGGNKFVIMRRDDIIVSTRDSQGEFGVDVFIRKDSPYFEKLKALFKAIKSDNKAEPLLDALRPRP